MRADKIHRAWRRGILSNGKRDRGSLSSFFSFRLVSLVSSFAKEETREMRQRKSKRKWILKNNMVFWNSTFLLFICNEKEIEISFKDERTTDGRPYIVVVNSSHCVENSVIIRFYGTPRTSSPTLWALVHHLVEKIRNYKKIHWQISVSHTNKQHDKILPSTQIRPKEM